MRRTSHIFGTFDNISAAHGKRNWQSWPTSENSDQAISGDFPESQRRQDHPQKRRAQEKRITDDEAGLVDPAPILDVLPVFVRDDPAGSRTEGARSESFSWLDQFPALDRIIADKSHLWGDNAEMGYLNILARARELDPNMALVGLSAPSWRQKDSHLIDCGVFETVA